MEASPSSAKLRFTLPLRLLFLVAFITSPRRGIWPLTGLKTALWKAVFTAKLLLENTGRVVVSRAMAPPSGLRKATSAPDTDSGSS